MSLGDLVISLSANTASLQSDMGKANQILERFASKSIQTSKQAEAAIKQLGNAGVTSVDRLKLAFDNLGIKTALQIENEKARMIASFKQIESSGVASANEIKRAHAAMKDGLNRIDLSSEFDKAATHSGRMNANIFASIGMIAKMQVMFSLINTTMSAVGQMPGVAVDAIEDFNSSIINNAAMITSMQKGVKDIGKAYQENKTYSTAVQNVLVKMDAETAASAKNLRDMNDQFVQQGILIDVNNKKQVDGFKSVANALSAITAGDPNQAMQFSQEIRAFKSFEDKGSNRLVQMLKAQGVTKEMFETWKASDTVLEEMGKRLQGFAAAQGDINNMWATVKSTMETIRDEVLRGGLAPGFAEIVKFMKEMNDAAVRNKEEIANGLNKGWLVTKGLVETVVSLFKSINPILEPVMGIVGKIFEGWGLIAAVALPTVGEKLLSIVNLTRSVSDVLTSLLKGQWDQMKASARSVSDEMANLFSLSGFDDRMAAWNKQKGASVSGTVKTPKGVTPPGGGDKKGKDPAIAWNAWVDQYNSFMISGEDEPLARKLLEIQKKANNLIFAFNELDESKKKAFDVQNAAWGGTVGAIKDEQRQNESRAIEEAMTKRIHQNQEEQKHFEEAIIALKKKSVAEAKKAYQEKAALAEAEIQDLIEQINLEEKLNKISGPEAIARRIPLEEKIVSIRKKLLSDVNSTTDPTGWRTAFRAVTTEQVKLLEDIKRQYDRTFQGGAEGAWASIRDNAANTGQQVHSVLTAAFNSALESLMNFTRTGKMEFGKFTVSILEMIAKIAFEKALAGIVGNAISGFSGMFGSNFSSVNSYEGGGSESGALLSSAPKLATGTNNVPRDMLAIIHKGEAVVPAAYNPATGGGSSSDIKIELVNQTGKEMKQKDGGMKFDGKQMIKTIILEAMDSDYSFRNAVRGG